MNVQELRALHKSLQESRIRLQNKLAILRGDVAGGFAYSPPYVKDAQEAVTRLPQLIGEEVAATEMGLHDLEAFANLNIDLPEDLVFRMKAVQAATAVLDPVS